jgi:hypothetical protein
VEAMLVDDTGEATGVTDRLWIVDGGGGGNSVLALSSPSGR